MCVYCLCCMHDCATICHHRALPAIERSIIAQPHKGPRKQIGMRIPEEIHNLLRDCGKQYGASSTSQFTADVLCLVMGRPDLAREIQDPTLARSLRATCTKYQLDQPVSA